MDPMINATFINIPFVDFRNFERFCINYRTSKEPKYS